VTEVCTPD
jgi:hypothetical protein